jgi:hypothetical protein
MLALPRVGVGAFGSFDFGTLKFMPTTARTISWTAHACNYTNSDVYLGIAPGLEDAALAARLGPRVLKPYPGRPIPITSGSDKVGTVPLRLYALREPAVCSIETLDVDADVPGFHRVKLRFDVASVPAHLQPAAIEIPPLEKLPPVVAFLLTCGLSASEEEQFFTRTVADFLDHSWSSFPRLLRELGCARASAAE